MKNSGQCPKCGSSDIFVIRGYAGVCDNNRIPVGMTVFSAIPVDRYVCGSCGYSEEWIRKEDLPKARNLAE